MNRRLSGMNQNDVEMLANDPTAVVMQPTYDNVFEPWGENRLIRAIDRIASISKKSVTKEEVDSLVNSDKELSTFRDLHVVIYKRISNPEVVKKTNVIEMVKFMLKTRAALYNQDIDENTARARISDKALSSLVNAEKDSFKK